MLRKLYLNGEMGEKFGKVAEVKAESVREVMQYLRANHDGVNKYLIDSTEKDIGFTIKMGDEYIDHNAELLLPLDKGDIIITPTPVGSKGAVKVIIGVVLIVAGLMSSQGEISKLGWAMISMGTSLVMQGIQEMMVPDPATDTGWQEQEGYIFQGAEQTVPEGYPVPVLYGELRVPGQPISFNLQNTGSMARNRQHSAGGIVVTGDEIGNYHRSPSTYESIQ